MVFGFSLMHAGFPRVGWVAVRGRVVKCSVCARVTMQCCGCGEPNRLSSDVHNELSQPWPLPALLGQKQGSDNVWAQGRKVGGGLGTVLSLRVWHLAGSENWVSWSDLCE